MPHAPKVKMTLEIAVQAKILGATRDEANGTVGRWRAIADDPETTNDLRGLAVHWRDELAGAVNRGDTAAQEAALQALSSTAARFLP